MEGWHLSTGAQSTCLRQSRINRTRQNSGYLNPVFRSVDPQSPCLNTSPGERFNFAAAGPHGTHATVITDWLGSTQFLTELAELFKQFNRRRLLPSSVPHPRESGRHFRGGGRVQANRRTKRAFRRRSPLLDHAMSMLTLVLPHPCVFRRCGGDSSQIRARALNRRAALPTSPHLFSPRPRRDVIAAGYE
jgi:hypothetical protein